MPLQNVGDLRVGRQQHGAVRRRSRAELIEIALDKLLRQLFRRRRCVRFTHGKPLLLRAHCSSRRPIMKTAHGVWRGKNLVPTLPADGHRLEAGEGSSQTKGYRFIPGTWRPER